MAKLVGTGKDPQGQYPAGTVFDVPEGTPHYEELLSTGYAELVPEDQHPGRSIVQIANAVVRGDALLDPAEQAIAASIGNRAFDIVRTQNPDAPFTGTSGGDAAAGADASLAAQTDGTPEGDLGDADTLPPADPAADYPAGDPTKDWTAVQLAAYGAAQTPPVTITTGTGKDGGIIKADWVKALVKAGS